MQRKKKGISNETNLPLLQLFYFCMIFIEQKIANHNHNLGQFSTDDFHLILAVGIGQGKKKSQLPFRYPAGIISWTKSGADKKAARNQTLQFRPFLCISEFAHSVGSFPA